MIRYSYLIEELAPDTLETISIGVEEASIIESFPINTLIRPDKNRVELAILTADQVLLETIPDYRKYTAGILSAGAGKQGESTVTLDPESDAVELGYETGDVILVYRFLNNLFSKTKFGGEFFISEISPDGTEILALSHQVVDEDIRNIAFELKTALNNDSSFDSFYLSFGEERFSIGLNVDYQNTDKGVALAIKLYQGLPPGINTNSVFTVESKLSRDKAFSINATPLFETKPAKSLQGPNFFIEEKYENNNPTEYFNYNELFSYPTTSSYYQLYSLFNEKSAQIAINHEDFNDFIHFSSVEERLRNFKYKLDLLQSYESNLETIVSSSYTDFGITGSKEYYQGLIQGIINNFDHYDRYLYYESGSWAWPKSGSANSRPYVNLPSSHPTASTWFNTLLESASAYDTSNFDILTNTIPTFIREDSNNEQYLMFVHMLAQHFDNIWIYLKSVSDKYDADNRLNFGISKDIVRSAIESFGINLYNSNQNIDNLFAMFVGEAYNTGSEYITTMSIATSGSEYDYLQPMPKDNYEKEIYKRLYHNIPYLLKTKGTERGLRALITTFGIPDTLLSIKTFGGVSVNTAPFWGPAFFTTASSTEQIRLDNTGSIVEGNTLSRYTSIVKKKPRKYTDDQHVVEVGFNISKATNDFIDLHVTSSFDIDDYIGDPRTNRDYKYERLSKLGRTVTDDSYWWDDIFTLWEDANWNWDTLLAYTRSPKAFIRLLNFFDGSLFRLIKDFVPARAQVNTGVILDSHKLARSKAPQVAVSWTDTTKSGSLSVGSYTGSQGGAYDSSGSYNYTTNYTRSLTVPGGRTTKVIYDESPMFNGELSGSALVSTTGELNIQNPFKQQAQPDIAFDLTLFNLSLPLPPACIIALSASYQGEFFEIYSTGSEGDAISGSIELTYPTTLGPSVTSLKFGHDFDTYEFFTVEAETSYYGGVFYGWYSGPTTGSTLFTTSSTLTVYYDDESTKGNKYYAIFN